MARPSLLRARSRSDSRARLADVDIVAEAADGQAAATIDGATVAALLDVVDDPDRLLDPEQIALELENVADLLASLAQRTEPPTAGALSIGARCVRQLATRVDALRPGAQAHARRFVVVRETPRAYVVPCPGRRLGVAGLAGLVSLPAAEITGPRMV